MMIQFIKQNKNKKMRYIFRYENAFFYKKCVFTTQKNAFCAIAIYILFQKNIFRQNRLLYTTLTEMEIL